MGRLAKSDTEKQLGRLERDLPALQEQLLYHESQVDIIRERITTTEKAIKVLKAIRTSHNGSRSASVERSEIAGHVRGEINAL